MPGELIEGYDLNALAPILSRSDQAPLPESVGLRVLEPEEPDPLGAVRVLETPEGRCVVSRRIVGAGAPKPPSCDVSDGWPWNCFFCDAGISSQKRPTGLVSVMRWEDDAKISVRTILVVCGRRAAAKR